MKYLLFLLLLIPYLTDASTQFELKAGQFEVRHNREDLKLEKLWIQTACFKADGTQTEQTCADVIVDEKLNNELIEFVSTLEKGNQLSTKHISIRYDEKSNQIFCVGMKALFERFPNRCDDVLYSEHLDRYSILSFCNVDVLPSKLASNPRFSHRRSRSWKDFANSFKQPIQLHLTSAGRPDWCDE